MPSPDRESALARAFDRAWAALLRAEGPDVDTAKNGGSLAARIVILAKLGETDEKAIADAALLYLRAFLAAKALAGGSPSAAARAAGGTAGPVLGQESISAAAAAYEACLEELPEGISASARSFLLQ